jgi:hypothetical protein
MTELETMLEETVARLRKELEEIKAISEVCGCSEMSEITMITEEALRAL